MGETVTAPRRIQRKRTAGWRAPEGAIIVDRTTRYGNPFRITSGVIVEHPSGCGIWTCGSEAKARQCATELYGAWLDGNGIDAYAVGRRLFDRRRILAAIDTGVLDGRDLACTCPLPVPGEPDWCHGAYLMERINATVVTQ